MKGRVVDLDGVREKEKTSRASFDFLDSMGIWPAPSSSANQYPSKHNEWGESVPEKPKEGTVVLLPLKLEKSDVTH